MSKLSALIAKQKAANPRATEAAEAWMQSGKASLTSQHSELHSQKCVLEQQLSPAPAALLASLLISWPNNAQFLPWLALAKLGMERKTQPPLQPEQGILCSISSTDCFHFEKCIACGGVTASPPRTYLMVPSCSSCRHAYDTLLALRCSELNRELQGLEEVVNEQLAGFLQWTTTKRST